MRDADIRSALHAGLLADQRAKGALVIDELGLWFGVCRVDIVVLTDSMHGYEIKSESDSLNRLPNQVFTYNRILEYVTLVVSPLHERKAIEIIPHWWGVVRAYNSEEAQIHFEGVREAQRNPNVEPLAFAAMLWREELQAALAERQLLRGYKRASRKELARRLSQQVDEPQLRSLVIQTIRHRVETGKTGLYSTPV